MIKKSFSTLTAFLLGAVISITVVACADDIQKIVTEECDCQEKWEELKGKLLSMDDDIDRLATKFDGYDIANITHYADGAYDAKIVCEYDDKARISKCKVTYAEGGSVTYTFAYEAGKCTISTDGTRHWVIELKNPISNNFEIVKIFLSHVLSDIC